MKVLVAGSRALEPENYINLIDFVIENKWNVWEFITGDAAGIDQFYKHYEDIKITKFPADWGKYGKSAGYRRNLEMGQYCDAAIIIWDGKSRGTRHMLDILDEYNKPYVLYKVTQ